MLLRARYKGDSVAYIRVGTVGGRVSISFLNWSGCEVTGTDSVTGARQLIADLQRAVLQAENYAARCDRCMARCVRSQLVTSCVSRCACLCGSRAE